jgi:hypothetical protein
MKRKRVLLGLILLITMMLSGCLLPPPGGFVVNDHPRGDYYQHHDQHYDRHDDHSYQQGWRGHGR